MVSEHLRLVVNDGKQTVPTDDQLMAASFIGIGESIISGKLNVERALVVAVVDGAVTYTAFGTVGLAEGIGLLELVSRKIERDMLNG